MTRYGNRKDETHKPIAAALRQVGALVFDVAQVAPEFGFDLLVAYRGRLMVVEVKAGDKQRGDLTANENVTRMALEGKGIKYTVVVSVDEAINIITRTSK